MSDSVVYQPDLTLVLGPDDSVIHVGPCAGRRPAGCRMAGRGNNDSVHVVVHRSHGHWTHVYRVQQEGAPDRLQVHLLKVYEGECAPEAQRWALAHHVATATP
ncbi:hypothetical protein [Azospirillum endophyticum]